MMYSFIKNDHFNFHSQDPRIYVETLIGIYNKYVKSFVDCPKLKIAIDRVNYYISNFLFLLKFFRLVLNL